MTSHAEILAKLRSSALGAATVRAFAALEADARIRNPDYIAREFLDAAVRPALGDSQKVAAFRAQLESILPGAYHFQNARTLHIDARLEKAIGDGCTQVVMLGAGFDSRAYRFGAQHKNVRFFEVDLPALQQEKKSKIAEFLGPPPDNVEYVALDFNTQTLQELLDMPAYDAALPTFFNWEGVSYYLTAAGVDATLAFVRVSAPGSRLLFDFMPRAMIDGSGDYYGGEQSRSYMAKFGEPLLFGIEDGTVETFLRDRGFALTSLLTNRELENTYLINSEGELDGRISGYVRIAEAEVM